MISLDSIAEVKLRHLLSKIRHKLAPGRSISCFDDDHPCVFVLSTGRVGSKTLASLLRETHNVVAVHEPLPKLFGLSRASYESAHGEAVSVFSEVTRVVREAEFEHAWRLGRGYVETSPQGTFLAQAIATLVPGARFIHLVRHPADIVRSGMRRGWYAGHPYDRTRIVPRTGSAHAVAWETYSPFEKNLWLWMATNEWILDFRCSIPPDRTLFLRAEDLFSGNRAAIESLFHFMSAPVPSNSVIARVLRARMNAQVSGEFPEHRSWTTDMLQAMNTFCGPIARELGYMVNQPHQANI